MKKSLIALAALSTIAGSVAAQSSVTVYGRLDGGYSNIEQTNGAGKTSEKKGPTASNYTSSRFGFNVVEDLGSGTKAIGTAEVGLNFLSNETDFAGFGKQNQTNPQGTSVFQGLRQGFVGLESAQLGTLTLGYQYTPEYYQRINNLGGSSNSVGMTGSTTKSSLTVVGRDEIDAMNSFQYKSPRISGVQATVTFGTGDTNRNAAFSANTTAALTAKAQDEQIIRARAQGLSLDYTAGALNLAASTLKQETKASAIAYTGIDANGVIAGTILYTPETTAAYDKTYKNNTVSGSYNFGVAKLVAVAANRTVDLAASNTSDTKAKVRSAGVQVPYGKFTFQANYATLDRNTNGTKTTDAKATNFGVNYNFSNRTYAYALVAEAKDKLAGTSTGVAKVTETAIGLAHHF